jgi:hypothetical protein
LHELVRAAYQLEAVQLKKLRVSNKKKTITLVNPSAVSPQQKQCTSHS